VEEGTFEVTIVIGYWGIPALLTILFYAFAIIFPIAAKVDEFTEGFYTLLFGMLATIVSLLTWCVYFAVT
jgi:Fe2+ transport system protein B